MYRFYYKGGKKQANKCWTRVCAELARHVFVRTEAAEAFRQKSVPEFLRAAGYVGSAAARNTTGTEARKEGGAAAAHSTAAAAASGSPEGSVLGDVR